ncbi:FKBP12-associated protein 1 [[Candida] railenensis]|uniref:FKBP12-associated protein 1 n=1 Tax=[Candida] railenensis TaxID=45579 RepID=A0A9P0W0F6_9ASCO|nr:FKBP12-associated protein 1 [[Candida] railenensis]
MEENSLPNALPTPDLPGEERRQETEKNNETKNKVLTISAPEEVTVSPDSRSLLSLTDGESSTYSSEVTEDDESSSAASSSDEDENEELSLSNRIMQEIQDGTYTCLVCTSEIDAFSKIWSCAGCYRVYDLDCIRDWALRGSSTDKSNKNWRCPACNIETNVVPQKFTCWCGKVKNPDPNELMPFSCGNPCNEPYEDCVHRCGSQCHPASHPVCGAMGPVMNCACGKSHRQLPCLITPYKEGWKCNEPCNTVICPLGHRCNHNNVGGCHSGFCGSCEATIDTVKCYCGKHDDLTIKCFERNPKNCSDPGNTLSKWVGYTDCGETTTIYHDCGIHSEVFNCEPLPTEKLICNFSPARVKTCQCGKTSVDQAKRTKCTDPIPECDNVCGKKLSCGCFCKAKCHSGECICYNLLDVKCSCENHTFSVPCRFIQAGYKPKCKHKCTVLLNCRKHYHKEVCCAYEQIAQRREREKKKAVRNGIRSSLVDENDIMTVEPAHICTQPCSRLKSCGVHQCEAFCHSGPCGTCYESSNDDLICNCGKTIIEAPVRCGTKLECHEQCIRSKECGHRLETHECHPDNIQCPKCTKLVTKECNCGNKKDMPNVLCSQLNVSCGKVCKVTKNCGHPCLKVCSESCTKKNVHASSSVCQSLCGKVRINCPHACKQKCHSNKVGKSKNCDAVRCSEEVTVQCECGNKSKTLKCGASLIDKSTIGTFLDCDEECLAIKRDNELKNAFNIVGKDITDDEMQQISLEEEIEYMDSVMAVYQRQKLWCSRIESQMRSFVVNYFRELESNSEGSEDIDIPMMKKSLHFPPASSPQRKFIHELASAFKLYSESLDEEPLRTTFVVITKSTVIPRLRLEEAILRKQEIINEYLRNKEIKQNQIQSSLCNAILIQDVFFGITKEILELELLKVASQNKRLNDLELHWIKGSTYCMVSKSKIMNMDTASENDLYLIMKSFKQVVRDKSLAFDCKLCLVDESVEHVLKTDEQIRILDEDLAFEEVNVDVEKEKEFEVHIHQEPQAETVLF